MATNLYDPSVLDYQTYFQYANKNLGSVTSIGNSDSSGNRCARFFCEPNTEYKIQLYMGTRFRIAGYAVPNTAKTAHYVIDPLDTNVSTAINQIRTLNFTTNATDTVLIIYYWTSSCTTASSTIRDSITIEKANQEPPEITVTSVDKTIISDETECSRCTASFTSSMALQSWEARATIIGASTGHGVGLLVESGDALAAGVAGQVLVDWNELTDGDTEYVITVYGLSEDGVWSDA